MMDRRKGRALGYEPHIAQSIEDILSTPIGSRVMRRDYGSKLPELIDAPISGETVIELYAATAEAIDLWEPRFALSRVQIAAADRAGALTLRLIGEVAAAPVTMDIEVTA